MRHKDNRPEYIIFAGVNGAGKSTFYHTRSWTSEKADIKMPRVNSDEILRDAQGDWASAASQAQAAKEAVKKARRLLDERRTFNQETTLSGRSSLLRIEEAMRRGYRTQMFYIGIQSPTLAQKRIAHRSEMGGHSIDEEVVLRRYRESLKNLSKAVRVCDEVVVLDNTIDFVEVVRWENGIVSWVGDLKRRGQWLFDAMKDETIWGS